MIRLLSELHQEGTAGYNLPPLDVPEYPLVETAVRALTERALPEVSEFEAVRHFTRLAQRNYSVDGGIYPLGSCTMKYNPKIHEELVAASSIQYLHPLQDEQEIQGALELMYDLTSRLCGLVGMKWGTLQSAAGAHGEYIGLSIIRRYHLKRGEIQRRKVLIPVSAHGTNPASAAMCGLDAVDIPVTEEGLVDVDALRTLADESVAAIMLTNPNTLGLWEKDIREIASIIHECGALLYYDGANMNAILNIVKPGEIGFDVVHLNLHKTFSTPHGGGGPGSGPILVSERLTAFLPGPDIVKENGRYHLEWDVPSSIGKTLGFFGNLPVLMRAYAYILSLGDQGLQHASKMAVLSANYVKERMKAYLPSCYTTHVLHEVVLSLKDAKAARGVSALSAAKALIARGFHPPTIYFPLIIKEAMMIEPTETETLEDLDQFLDTLIECIEGGEGGEELPLVDEVLAAKKPVLQWKESEGPDRGKHKRRKLFIVE